jgi:hypothetical protein
MAEGDDTFEGFSFFSLFYRKQTYIHTFPLSFLLKPFGMGKNVSTEIFFEEGTKKIIKKSLLSSHFRIFWRLKIKNLSVV